MDDPAYPTEEDLFAGPDEWLADVRSWRAEQRAKYGMDWKDTDLSGYSDYERSRGIVPPDAKPPK